MANRTKMGDWSTGCDVRRQIADAERVMRAEERAADRGRPKVERRQKPARPAEKPQRPGADQGADQ